MKTYCGWCGSSFSPPYSEIKRGGGKFCSKKCSARYAAHKRGKAISVPCAYCGIILSRKISRLSKSKTGLSFCSVAHKNKFQKSKIRNRDEPKYPNYRKLAFGFYPHECHDCGYKEHKGILVVHHIDGNRSNNSLENLMILCPNCHSIRHKK